MIEGLFKDDKIYGPTFRLRFESAKNEPVAKKYVDKSMGFEK